MHGSVLNSAKSRCGDVVPEGGRIDVDAIVILVVQGFPRTYYEFYGTAGVRKGCFCVEVEWRMGGVIVEGRKFVDKDVFFWIVQDIQMVLVGGHDIG